MTAAEDKKSNGICRFCGSHMPNDFVFCKECNHFNDWRRFFAVSTPVLGLLVALVSVVGINANNLKEMVAPPRANLLIGAEFNGETNDFEVVATNIGGAVGYLEQMFECIPYVEGGSGLSFRSSVPAIVLPGHQITVQFKTNSTFFDNFLAALEDEVFIPAGPTDGYGRNSLDDDLGGPWLCAIEAHDALGNVEVSMSSTGLSLYLRNGTIHGNL